MGSTPEAAQKVDRYQFQRPQVDFVLGLIGSVKYVQLKVIYT